MLGSIPPKLSVSKRHLHEHRRNGQSKWCGLLSIPDEVNDGSTESGYPPKPRNFKSVLALVKKHPSCMW